MPRGRTCSIFPSDSGIICSTLRLPAESHLQKMQRMLPPRIPNPPSVRQGNGLVYRAESDPTALLRRFPAIRALADGEKEAIGFLPEAAYHAAVERRRLGAT